MNHNSRVPSGHVFVVRKNLFAQFIDKLIEAKVDFRFNFIVQKLFAEDCQSIVCGVIVQV